MSADGKVIPIKAAEPETVTVEDFYAYMPSHEYIFVPTREIWPCGSVNVRCEGPRAADGSRAMKKVAKEKNGATEFKDAPISPSEWLDQERPVDQMTWAPGEPMVIEGRLVSGGGWIERPGCSTFNLYRPPSAPMGDASKATRWIEHVKRVFPDEYNHIITWLAHRVQHPGEKINHALVLGGAQGVGKDTLLEPVKYAVGPWNFTEVTPAHLLGRFNGFVKSVILRVNEARDLGDVDRFGFYDHLKMYTASPPDVLRCDEKNIREHAVMNVCGVIITSNHKSDGIYLPADDRRHYVAWSELTREAFTEDYWRELYRWYAAGGTAHVGAYLAAFDLSAFDPKAPPGKTTAFWDIVDANRAPEDAELADVLDALRNPAAVTLTDIVTYVVTNDSFRDWLKDRRNSRQVPHRMEAAGYVAVRNPHQTDGRWKVEGKNVVIYAKRELAIRDRIVAAQARCGRT